MKPRCACCDKPARLEAHVSAPNRDENPNPWINYCLECLTQLVPEKELDVRRLGHKK